jgi:hypothetical protein
LNTSPARAVVGDILVRLGYRPSSVERFGGFHGFAGFKVYLDDGQQLIVKVINRDLWASVLPVQLYRAREVPRVGRTGPFRSLRSAVEHEALCALKAHSDGVPCARLAVIADYPPNAMMMGSTPNRASR